MIPLLLLAAGVVVAAVAIRQKHLDRELERFDAWVELCGSLNLDYSLYDEDLPAQCGDFALFQRYRSRAIPLVLRGRSGRITFAICDMPCGSGLARAKPRHLTLCVLEREGMKLPHSRLRPERWGLDLLGQLLGAKDIDFADDPAFSQLYVLQGVEEDRTRELFDARVRQWFVERQHLKPYVETLGPTVIFAVPQLGADEASRFLDQGLELLMLLAEWCDTRAGRSGA